MIVRCVQRNGFRARLWRFAWDEFDRLREVLTPEGERWRYRYDAFGRRISKQCEGVCRHRPRRIDYLWQGSRLVEEWCSYERETGDTRARNEIRRWHYRPGSHAVLAQERLCYEREPSLPESEWYPLACDPNGAPHTMYNSEGRAVWRARSSLWGETARDTTSVRMREMLRHVVHDPYLAACLTAGDETLECELRFAGQWADEESGLHYNCQRYYDPQTGQYLSGDPIGLEGGLNVYRYAPNPLGWIDPWGLMCGDPVAARKVEIPAGKFDYLFGRVSSNAHNAARSNQLALEMKRLGVQDTEMGRQMLSEHLVQSVNTEGNIARTFSNQYGNFEVRESLFMGPSGFFAKFESTFQVLDDGVRRLSTVIPFGGG